MSLEFAVNVIAVVMLVNLFLDIWGAVVASRSGDEDE